MIYNIDKLVDRFLAWQLPASVCSDLCVTNAAYPHSRSGTNLLTADEAKAMLEHVLAESAPEPGTVPALHREGREPLSRVIGQLRALLTRLHPNYPEHASLAGAIKQLEGFTPPPPAVDYEAAIKLVWETIDPFRPAGQPGSYARGYYNGTIFALEQLRSNLDAARASATKRADDVDTLERRFKCAFCEKQFLTAEVRGHHQEECLGKGERDE